LEIPFNMYATYYSSIYLVISPFISHKSSQLSACSHKNTWPFINREFLSLLRILSISSSVNGFDTVEFKLLMYSASTTENGIGTCPLCTAHFKQTTAG